MESLNIDGLIKTYSWLLDTLKSIQKEQSNAWTIDILRSENKKLRSENERLEEQVKWNNKHIRILSHELGKKICPDCGWAGWFDDWYGNGWPCETCKTEWVVPNV